MANHSFNCDFTDLSREEIIEEYQKLSAKFAAVKTSEEVALQKNHEYRRNLQLALNREEHLTHELEAFNEQKGSVSLESSEKLRAELEVFRRRMEEAKERAEIAEADAEQLRQEVARLVVEQSAKQPAASSVVNESILSDNQREHLDNLEAMNAELLQSHEMHQTELVEVMQQLSEMKRSEENLMDRLQCAEENLQAKRDELEEKSVLIDSLEEKVAILTAELGSLQSEAANPSKKNVISCCLDHRYWSLFSTYLQTKREIRCLVKLTTNGKSWRACCQSRNYSTKMWVFNVHSMNFETFGHRTQYIF